MLESKNIEKNGSIQKWTVMLQSEWCISFAKLHGLNDLKWTVLESKSERSKGQIDSANDRPLSYDRPSLKSIFNIFVFGYFSQ